MHLSRAVISAMHVDMFKLVRNVKLNARALRTPTQLRSVVLVTPTASVAVLARQTRLARVAVMPAMLSFMSRTVIHTA